MVGFLAPEQRHSEAALTGRIRNDILRKHGIIPEKPPSPTPLIEEALMEACKQTHDKRLENKGLDELDELEDEEDAEFLERYRYDRPTNPRTPVPNTAIASNGWQSYPR